MDTSPKSMKKLILQGIRKTLIQIGSATKVELSEKLNISFPTISKFLAEMEKDGELLLVGLDESSGGRRAKRYRYNPEYMLGLAIFLERTETHYIVFNCLGEEKEVGRTSSFLVEEDLTLLKHFVEGIVKKFPKISSIAIGVPGSVADGEIFFIPGYEHFQNVDLKGYMETTFDKPVIVENDMNAAVFGYHHMKEEKKSNSLVYLYSGQNGPGAGIIVNGTVVQGSTNFSGEISFVPQYDDRNFGQSLESGKEDEIDAISRLVASFVAIINPHTFIFSEEEVNQSMMNEIGKRSSHYIPKEHLPAFKRSNWKQDYLFGLQSLGLEQMIQE